MVYVYNSKMKEFSNKVGLKIEFGSTFSPWSNGINERIHCNADVAVRMIMEENNKITLQEAVNISG